MWKLYDTLIENLPDGGTVSSVTAGRLWTMAELSGGSTGVAMTTEGSTIPPTVDTFAGLSVKQAASLVKSWNLPEATAGMAVINGCYNTPERMEDIHCYEPYERYCTQGLDFTGKTVGVIGHMNMPKELLQSVQDVYILERHPQPGDYPDSACEYLLPKCDIVLITGSSLVNKTLPRLLELCRNAYTILTGPTVPMCPELLNLGIDRIAGMAVVDPVHLKPHVAESRNGPPYPYGKTFLLKR